MLLHSCSTDRGCNRLGGEQKGPLEYPSFVDHWMRRGPLACFRTDDEAQPRPRVQQEACHRLLELPLSCRRRWREGASTANLVVFPSPSRRISSNGIPYEPCTIASESRWPRLSSTHPFRSPLTSRCHAILCTAQVTGSLFPSKMVKNGILQRLGTPLPRARRAQHISSTRKTYLV